MDRITGRVSADGTAYELVQGGKVLKSTPIDDAKACQKHKAAIERNKWEALP
jgi:hypothetical protein